MAEEDKKAEAKAVVYTALSAIETKVKNALKQHANGQADAPPFSIAPVSAKKKVRDQIINDIEQDYISNAQKKLKEADGVATRLMGGLRDLTANYKRKKTTALIGLQEALIKFKSVSETELKGLEDEAEASTPQTNAAFSSLMEAIGEYKKYCKPDDTPKADATMAAQAAEKARQQGKNYSQMSQEDKAKWRKENPPPPPPTAAKPAAEGPPAPPPQASKPTKRQQEGARTPPKFTPGTDAGQQTNGPPKPPPPPKKPPKKQPVPAPRKPVPAPRKPVPAPRKPVPPPRNKNR